jgi:hypothetical protein
MLEKLKHEFLQPDNQFSPIPFWFWNDKLTKGEISRQICDFHDKGISGLVIHPRIGMPREIEYLSDEFMRLVRFAVVEAVKLDMKIVLYDEAMYPSGSAHGMVVKGNPEYASRGLRMMEYPSHSSVAIIPQLDSGESLVAAWAVEKIAVDAIKSGSERKLELRDGKIIFETPAQGQWSVLLFIETFSGGTIRGIHFGEDDEEPGAPPAGDLLNPEAVQKFIGLTYDRYYETLAEYFGNTVIAMFTDEPDVLGRCAKPDLKPWTGNFLEYYQSLGNAESTLPALWFKVGLNTQILRQNYHRAIKKRLESSYYQQLFQWCQTHGVALTGHPQESEDIGLLKYFHIPGQDLVWRWVAPEEGRGVEGPHSTLAKCSSDAARHQGKRRNSNECFGCCGPSGIPWGFSAADMKWYLDWLFVRGVNLIYPHAFYYSIRGPKRIGERPPDVGPNNIWWRHYHTISNYIKRMSWLTTDSVNVTPVAVLCTEDHLPWQIVKPLYQQQLEFNYLEERLLFSEACRIANGYIFIEQQKYRVLVIEDITMVTMELAVEIQKFKAGGGIVICYNPNHHPNLLQDVVEIATVSEIVPVIEKYITPDLILCPANENLRVSHIRKEGQHFYLLVNEGDTTIKGELQVRASGRIEIWDAWEGQISQPEWVEIDGRDTRIPFSLQHRDSRILAIDHSTQPVAVTRGASGDNLPQEWELAKNWKISNADCKTPVVSELGSWTQWPGMEDFSGMVTYETELEIPESPVFKKIELDLGRVGEIAQLYINGVDAGFKLWFPYVFDITGWVQSGRNSIRVDVTNTLANRINRAKFDSGLLGPVKVKLLG